MMTGLTETAEGSLWTTTNFLHWTKHFWLHVASHWTKKIQQAAGITWIIKKNVKWLLSPREQFVSCLPLYAESSGSATRHQLCANWLGFTSLLQDTSSGGGCFATWVFEPGSPLEKGRMLNHQADLWKTEDTVKPSPVWATGVGVGERPLNTPCPLCLLIQETKSVIETRQTDFLLFSFPNMSSNSGEKKGGTKRPSP